MIPLECQGIHIRPIAADAHYQLGKTESHGRWFERVLAKVLDEHNPKTKEEWLECVHHAHIKNAMIQNHGVTPHQFVFGRNPTIPSDLMDEPSNVVAKTVSHCLMTTWPRRKPSEQVPDKLSLLFRTTGPCVWPWPQDHALSRNFPQVP